MGFRGLTSKNAAHHKIPMISGVTSYGPQPSKSPFVVPNDRVNTAAKTLSTNLLYYQRSPVAQLVLPNSGRLIDIPDIPTPNVFAIPHWYYP